MTKNYFFRSILIVSTLFISMNFGFSQDTANHSVNESELTLETEETIFEYKDTPEYVFINRKNFMKDFNDIQLEIMDAYGYPKFISTNDKYQIELDIKLHWEAVVRWEEENVENIGEILEALETNK